MAVKKANPQLVQYIKAQLEAGYDIGAIEQVILKAGYKQDDVDAAIDSALMDDGVESAGKKKKTGKNKKIVAFAAIILLVAALGGGVFFWLNQNASLNADSDLPVETAPPAVEPPVAEEEVVPENILNASSEEPESPLTEENVTSEENSTDNAEEEEIMPDEWIGPPVKDPDMDNIVVFPTNGAYTLRPGKSAAITVKVLRTDYIADLRPKIDCDYIPVEKFATYEYEGNASVDEIAEVTFVFKGSDSILFSECHFKLSATDAHVIDHLFYITVKEG
ncbi:hypothetical protein D6764_03595 [Candidatus Woesearchaeota archaeon]|nr:MAG: hypothetical protein D6764_03595 [Candidatus Woesearchaeota archaeon]